MIENLKWDEHINIIILKMSAKICIFKSLRNTVLNETLTLLFNVIVLSHFDYADTVYYSASETNKTILRDSTPELPD